MNGERTTQGGKLEGGGGGRRKKEGESIDGESSR